MTVDFTPTDEQQMVADTMAALFVSRCPPSVVRRHVDDPAAADPLTAALSEWVVLADADLADLTLAMIEHGRAAAPGPWFATTALFVPLLRAAGLDADADEAAAGRITGTVAMAGADGRWEVSDDPQRTYVLEADRVDRIAWVLTGPSVAVTDAVEVEAAPLEWMDLTRRPFTVDVPDRAGAVDVSADAVRAWLERATVALAADMIGTARWLLDAAVAYATERHQFGVPIGSFQAVQHGLADMALDIERAEAAVLYAAMTVDDDDPDRHRAVHVAKAAAGQAATHAAKQGMQTHGGIGYTWEHDLHFHLRRAFASEALLGTTDWHHDRLADLLFAEG